MLKQLLTKAEHLLRGEQAEQQAYHYLIKQGLKPVCRNFRCKQGELDLIMSEHNTLVIVEVRYRKSDKYGSAAESVTARKQSRIIAATEIYLTTHATRQALRFDVLTISGDGSIGWIKNAF